MEGGEISSFMDLDPERQKRAKEYARINHRLMLVDLLFTAVFLVACLVFGWSKGLSDWLMGITTNEWMLVFLYILIFGGILYLINLPLSYYQSYLLPHQYELSNETPGGWISDQLKMIAVGGVIGIAILEIIYAVLRAYPTTWWLWAAGILLVLNVILEKIAPTILMPMFNKFVPLGDEHADLKQRIMQISQRSGTIVIGVFKFDMSKRTKQANAGLAGSGKTRRIILGDTLLTSFSRGNRDHRGA
jgi:STE24 endopeptidase